MRCEKCGHEVEGDYRFCLQCGAEMPQEQAEEKSAFETKPQQSVETDTSGWQRPSPPRMESDDIPRKISTDGLVGTSLSDAWAAFKANTGLFIGMGVTFFLIIAIANGLMGNLLASDPTTLQIMTNLWSLIQNVFTAGILFVALKVLRGEQTSFSEMFSGFSLFLPIVLSGFVSIIGIVIGFMLLIVPGVILALGLSQYLLLIMDKQLPGIESLKASWHLMSGYKGSFFLLGLALIGINILGILALGIGLLVTIPLSMVAVTAFYNRITGGAYNPEGNYAGQMQSNNTYDRQY